MSDEHVEQNGQPQVLPEVTVAWDEEKQGVIFKMDGFKNLAFVAAVLRMAAEHAETMQKMQLIAAQQQAAMQAQQAQAIKSRLKL